MNRPKVLNSFTNLFMLKLGNAIRNMDSDPGVAAIVLTGGDKVFSSGGDIRGMQDLKFQDCYWKFMENFDTVVTVRKPVIAAVNGYAVGGGCELAMRCDIILAGENAKFGIPDSKIGAIAGGGGTQWLPHIIGKSRAMQMCLLGETITAQQANEWGLVSSVHPADQVVDEAVQLGERIAQHSKLIVAMCKESINNSFNLPLSQGLHFERRLSNITFATNDRLEGMTAFAEKRTPKYTDS
ncbi:enoyl-CoA hydratase, mitochondrial isoform X2 [Procambarus clarkii]|nr:enoyl-CoA hydratase, mitochondrial-like isoform X2 [Procambarus clarkii]